MAKAHAAPKAAAAVVAKETVTMQCLTPFPNGVSHTINGHKITFQHNASGHCIAEVLKSDVQTLKSISAGYVEYNGADSIEYDEEVEELEVADTPGADPLLVETSTAFLAPTTTQFAPPKVPKARKVAVKKAK